jgi:hypothetical protein
LRLLASAFRCRLCLGHPSRHLGFDGVKIKARAPLHRRVFEEGLNFFGYDLLNKNKAPELELEPIEVLLRPVFRPVSGPALALEWIETEVDQIGYVHMRLFTQPALGLVNETILIVVNVHRANGAFPKVKDFVTGRRAFPGDGVYLVLTVEVVLVCPIADLHALK